MNEGDLPSSVCRGVGLRLQEHGRLHGVRPDKRAIVRGDQHDANSNGRREDSHGDGRRRPIVDVDHRNRRQHADRLHDETHPLDWIHLRLTDQDPLAAGFEPFSSEATIARCAAACPSPCTGKARVICTACANEAGIVVIVARPLAIAGHSAVCAS